MELEQSLKTAIEYEKKVHATYKEAVGEITDPAGKRVFGVLAREELEHIQYLQSCLIQWQEDGAISGEALATALPGVEEIEAGLARLKETVSEKEDPRPKEIELLRRAVAAEQETSGFYRKMVDELPAEQGALFARFLEIEEGHLAIVGAELDAVAGFGYWFDNPEWKFADG